MKYLTSPLEKKLSVEELLNEKIIAKELIAEKVHELKALGLSIATLNGSFDLLHAGHLYILFEAKKQADVLIVALNSDRSIQQYKGSDRPIITLENRLKMMASIGFVDYVTYFEETDPRELLKQICPAVHVNGAEYGYECIEHETLRAMGARLHLVERIPALATSDIIQKIKRLCDS